METKMDKKTIKDINEIRESGDFRTIKNKIGEERLKEFINSIYPKFSLPEIETITSIPDSTLGYWLKKLNIPTVRRHITNYSIPGDSNSEIVVTKNNITKKVSMVEVTPELAYLIGFTLGDGSVQKFMIEVFNKDKILKEILYKILKPYGTITEEERDYGLWRLRLSSVKIANLIKEDNKLRKDTIDYIFSNDKLARKFIAAFWDAEGSVWYTHLKPNYYHIYLFNSDRYLLGKIKDFLENKGIKFSLSIKNPIYRKTKDGRIIKSKKIVERISIPKSPSIKWAEEIGIHMNHSNKSNNVKKLLQGAN